MARPAKKLDPFTLRAMASRYAKMSKKASAAALVRWRLWDESGRDDEDREEYRIQFREMIREAWILSVLDRRLRTRATRIDNQRRRKP